MFCCIIIKMESCTANFNQFLRQAYRSGRFLPHGFAVTEYLNTSRFLNFDCVGSFDTNLSNLHLTAQQLLHEWRGGFEDRAEVTSAEIDGERPSSPGAVARGAAAFYAHQNQVRDANNKLVYKKVVRQEICSSFMPNFVGLISLGCWFIQI